MPQVPKVSVVMSVYNGESYLNDSISSILEQSFKDFEFIIINDGSTDGTKNAVEKYAKQDPRIKIINQENTGLTIALNNALKQANGEYIARQDVDDISLPHRLEKQIKIMDTRSDIVLCGGACINLFSNSLETLWRAQNDQVIKHSIFYKTPFAHSTAMMKADTAKKLGYYDTSFKTAQDSEFWMRFAKTGQITMVQTPILKRRVDKNSISSKRRWRQFYDGFRARWKHNTGFRKLIGAYYSVRIIILDLMPDKLLQHLITKPK